MQTFPPPGATLAAIRARRPLVHCLTNPVAANLTANMLLCLGAAPLMAEDAAEMARVAGFTDALLVNLGMQVPPRMDAARAAIRNATAAGTPWVLDPVAAGAIPQRFDLAHAMTAEHPTLIKGNVSEILALAGAGTGGRGTDATDDAADALGTARLLATRTGAAVAMTGPVDWITDGGRTATVRNGHAMMAQVSGLGCVAGAVAAACLAVQPDALVATAHALALLGIAAERAIPIACGPGTLPGAMLDALHALGSADADCAAQLGWA